MINAQAVAAETLKQYLEAFNRHDLDAILEFFADDCCTDLPRGPEPWGTRLIGKAQVRAVCASRCACRPDAHYGEDRHWVCGNMGFSEWTLTGTTLSGEPARVRETDHLEFHHGKIVQKNSFWKIVET